MCQNTKKTQNHLQITSNYESNKWIKKSLFRYNLAFSLTNWLISL